jgi:hypothetical protein
MSLDLSLLDTTTFCGTYQIAVPPRVHLQTIPYSHTVLQHVVRKE